MLSERFDRTVYKCDLFSITPEIRVNHDESRYNNIKNAKIQKVEEVMVQPTFKKNIYREIVTRMPIPVYKIGREHSWYFEYGDLIFERIPYRPVFIIIKERYKMGLVDWVLFDNDLKVATAEDVKNYIRLVPKLKK